MKKILYSIFVIIFFAVAVTPFAGMLFYKADGSAEQRELSEKPSIIVDKKINRDFGSGFEDYFGDHFAFRSELVNADAALKLKVFDTSAEDKVITGKGEWLYYTETLGDFCGTNELTDGEIQRIADIITMEKNYCLTNGRGYVFSVAPNKNSIYPENMKSFYKEAGNGTNLSRLTEKLALHNVEVADLKDALIKAKDSGKQLYYTYDSHWNLMGAGIGYNTYLESIKKQTDVTFPNIGWNEKNFTSGVREGDLLKMVQPLDKDREELYAEDKLATTYKPIGKPAKSVDDLIIKNKCETGADVKLLMFRDSFGRALIKPLSMTFRETTLVRSVPFDIYSNIDNDTVVVREIVERNIKTLLDYAPIVLAEETEISGNTDVSEGLSRSKKQGKLTHYYGYVLSDEAVDYYRVGIVTKSGKTYAAFPVLESEIRDNAPDNAVGYSFYAPADDNDFESFEVVVQIQK